MQQSLDLATLARAARELEVVVEGRTFQLLAPTPSQQAQHLVDARGTNRRRSEQAVARRFTTLMVEDAIAGWSGVLISDLMQPLLFGVEDGPAQFTAENVELLVDQQPIWVGKLGDALFKHLNAQLVKTGQAAKN